ncbi:ribosomal-protein-alanine N-acetyltransferase [Serratia marcescens]|uniref:Ribosomal-protein-alanine N-acetyltransferase n=1 Tax=Serratia marcescens TaxID=615 RepID=A0A379Y349_SERMA|nr:ribosomal-protein-alanine N-acetyltransferase [Serratia marcescens]
MGRWRGSPSRRSCWTKPRCSTSPFIRQHQRRGFGRLLLNALIEQLESRGVVTLWLEVRASNQAAIALYEDLGFNEVTVRRNYYPSAHGREDAIVMAMPLG